MNQRIYSRRLALTATAIGTALAIAACSPTHSTGVSPAAADQALDYVRCLRSHGVPAFPDPGPGGRLPNIPSDIDTTAPAFRSAQNACVRLMPGGSATRGTSGNGSDDARLLAVARCMRGHGLPNFPDPTPSPPQPPPAGSRTGNAIGGPGGYLAFPPPSPALTRAEAVCGFRLP
ncbi:MAG TPA: hypothetical protein VMJ65_20425 [Solirubrobacteraceae bacterium]|nr:hypothetical protein [Solirubrobacteraceae bacterium]